MKKNLFVLIIALSLAVVQKMQAQEQNENYVTITTSGGDYDGMWYFNVAPYEAPFVPGCWVDWNDNGTKEEGEEITEADWMDSVSHEIVSKKITIYGDITYLNLYGLTLTDVDLSNTDVLEFVDLSGNLLETVDLSKNKSIKDIVLSDNPFSSIDLVNAPQLRSLSLSMNVNLKTLDISTQKSLTDFVFTDNEYISDFDFTANPNLEFLYLEAIPMEKIDLTPNTRLTQVSIGFSSLKEIKLPVTDTMKSLALHNNQLSGSLDVSAFTNLEDVFFQNNNINNFKIAKDLKNLYIISCYMNDLQTADFMPVIDNLYDRTSDPSLYRGCIFMVDSEPYESEETDKNSLTETAVTEAMNKGWDVIDYAGANMYPYPGVDDATAIKDVRRTAQDIEITNIAGQPAAVVPVSMIGSKLYVYDMSGALVTSVRLTSALTRIPALSARKGVYMFKTDRKTIKKEI